VQVTLTDGTNTWPVAWGLNLVGTSAECDIRLPPGDGVPPAAGVLARWTDGCWCLAIGEDGLRVKDRQRRWVRLDLTWNVGPDFAVRHVTHPLLVGDRELELHCRLPTVPAAEGTTAAALLAAFEAGRRMAADGREAIAALAMITGATTARLAVRPESATVSLGSSRGLWDSQGIDLEWCAGERPSADDLAAASREIAGLLDYHAGRIRGDVAGWAPSSLVDAYRSQVIGPIHVIDDDDLSHHGCDIGRSPLAVVSTVHGVVDLVNLGALDDMSVEGRPFRRRRLTLGEPFDYRGITLRVERTSGGGDIDPDIFSSLGAWTDPLTQAVRLGMTLERTSDERQRLTAHLTALVTVLGAAGAFVGYRRDDAVGVGPVVVRSWDGTVSRQVMPAAWFTSELLSRTPASGDVVVYVDSSSDERLFPTDVVVPDGLFFGWAGSMVLLPAEGFVLVVWRPKGRVAPFVERDRQVLAAHHRMLSAEPRPDWRPLSVRQPGGAPVDGPRLACGRLQVPLQPVTTVGRDPNCTVQAVFDPCCSRHHALVIRAWDGWRVIDFRSSNGVYVNGRRVQEARLADGDTLDVSSLPMVFHTGAVAGDGLEERDHRPAEPLPPPFFEACWRHWGGAPLAGVTKQLSRIFGTDVRSLDPDDGHSAWQAARLRALQAAFEGNGDQGRFVDATPSAPVLRWGERTVVIDEPLWIGRADDCAIVVADDRVSRKHALVLPEGGDCLRPVILDFKTSLGTRVNGSSIELRRLCDGDVIEVGSTRFHCTVPAVVPAGTAAFDRGLCSFVRMQGLLWATSGFDEAVDLLLRNLPFRSVTLVGRAAPDAPWDEVRPDGGVRVVMTRQEPFHQSCPAARRLLGEAAERGVVLRTNLDEPAAYRQHMHTVPLREPLRERSILAVPLPAPRPTVLFATSYLSADVAFPERESEAYRWLGSLLYERCRA